MRSLYLLLMNWVRRTLTTTQHLVTHHITMTPPHYHCSHCTIAAVNVLLTAASVQHASSLKRCHCQLIAWSAGHSDWDDNVVYSVRAATRHSLPLSSEIGRKETPLATSSLWLNALPHLMIVSMLCYKVQALSTGHQSCPQQCTRLFQ